MAEAVSASVVLRGEYACFTRPEFKAESVSYDVITPSAARGALEAIFWKPEFRYRLRRIGIVKQGSATTLMRNGISDRQGDVPLVVENQRVQTSSLVLRDVAYILEADIVLRPHATDPSAKYAEIFARRVRKGQCFHRPYLGTREFAADFEPTGETKVDDKVTRDYGLMLFEQAYVPTSGRAAVRFRRAGEPQAVDGNVQALFFPARVEAGWIDIPGSLYDRLDRLEGWRAA